MRNFGLLVAAGLLLTGASPCGGGDDDPGVGEGDGSQGGAGTTAPGGDCAKQPCGDAGSHEGGSGGHSGSSGHSGGGTASSTEPAGGTGGGEAGGGDDPAPSPVHCGGIAGRPCPGAGTCVDDPSDDCDPDKGGADCGGLCECSAAAVSCLTNTTFNDDPSVCECEPADGGGGGVACGPNTCDEGQVCCNESCGICTEPDGVCTQEACEPTTGGSCDLTCDAGEHCELVQVTCVRAPCPPLPQCVPSPSCGGFAGFSCPGEGECLDNPNDDCDPEMGGADCGGYCSCTVGPLIDCAPDLTFDPSPKVCACVKPTAAGDGVQCGDETCADGEVCCNASCGICTPPDGACIQEACN